MIDANGWAHFATSAVADFKFDKSVTGAAAFANAKGHRRLVVVREDGNGVELGISPDGALASKPVSIQLPGLKNCTSLAYFDGQLLAADGGTLVVFNRTENDRWKESARLNSFGEQIFIHSDGKRLVVSDTQHHMVHLFDSLKTRVATFGTFDTPGSTIRQLNAPAHVAVQGKRVVVYDRGNQRLVRLELTDGAVAAGHQAKRWSGQVAAPPVQFADADFQELGRPGGIAFAVAVDESQQGLSISEAIREDSPGN